MVSQKDIARKLGVSRGLVSKVLSGRMSTTRIDPELRRKIIRKARALGYKPNRTELGLFSGKHGAIAIFVKPWGVEGAELLQRVLWGISDALRPTMYYTWLCIFETVHQFQKRMDMRELRNRVDALLIGGAYKPEFLPILRKLEKTGIPVVTFFQGAPKMHIPTVTVDPRVQGRLATEHLIARGCRRIAHFSIYSLRTSGYRQALRAAGLAYDPRLVVEVKDWEIDDGHRGARELLARNIAFDGIFASSDHQAYGALQELIQRGIRVPEDVRIVGVDDAPLCRAEPITLSSVTSEGRAVGREAVAMISRKLAGEKVESRYLLPHIIQRRSS